MKYAKIKKCDVANGPGVRVSLFVSGCNHHCKNCFNREAWDFNYGKEFTEDEQNEIIEDLKTKQAEIQNTITEIKNSLEGKNSSLQEAEGMNK